MKNILLLVLSCLLIDSIHATDTLHVKSPDQFLRSIGPHRVLLIETDTIQLRKIPALAAIPEGQEGDYTLLEPYVFYAGGNGMIIKGVEDLQIIGKPTLNNHSIICTSDYDNTILTFRNCRNVRLQNMEFNHIPHSEGGCSGGVLFFDACKKVDILHCNLIGSGMFGLLLDNDTTVRCKHTTITECSETLFEIQYSVDMQFDSCVFSYIRSAGSLISIEYETSDLHFRQCRFEHNALNSGYEPARHKSYIFYFYEPKKIEKIEVTGCKFTGNDYQMLSNRKGLVKFSGNTYPDNEALGKTEDQE